MSNKKQVFSSDSHEDFLSHNEPSDNEKLENQNDWFTELIPKFKLLMLNGGGLLLGGGYLFIICTLAIRKDSSITCHSNQNMVASMTSACHSNNGMGTSIPSITRSSEILNQSISKSTPITAKIHSNTSKASSFHRTESFNRTKTTWSFSIEPPTVHPQYRVLCKKMDQSPSSCRAIIENPNFGAMGSKRGNSWRNKQDKKKTSTLFTLFVEDFFGVL